MSPPPLSRRPSSTATAAPSLLPSPLPKETPTASFSSVRPTPQNPQLKRSLPRDDFPHDNFPHDGAAELIKSHISDTPLPFEPFFSLVEDARATAAHHPAVHYIFSDDDTEVLPETLLTLALTPQTQKHTPASPAVAKGGVRDRYVVVTLGENGRSVASAQSLTGDWQVLGAEVSAAPMLEGEEGETGGLMLRIQGTSGVGEDGGGAEGDVEGAVERFRERMTELRRVVDGRKEGAAL